MDEQKRLALALERVDLLADAVHILRAENERLEASRAEFARSADDWRERAIAARAALEQIAAGNPGAPKWLTDVEMANIARKALEGKE